MMGRIFKFLRAIYCWCSGGCKVSLSSTERMQICKTCEHYKAGVCSMCGCVLKYKTKMETERCPIDKW